MKNLLISLVTAALLVTPSMANTISENQQQYIKKYAKQKTIPAPEAMLINTDPEPGLTDGFSPLFNGKNLAGWSPKAGTCSFEVIEGSIVGTCVPKSPNTFLCTDKEFSDFIFTCEMKWEVDGNSGVMFRARSKKDDKGNVTVYGPQCEMEGINNRRGWSGGIYGEKVGGWLYPLWLEAHEEVRNAIKTDDWNRITIKADGDTVKTWLNGIPATHWKTEEYMTGFFGLQVHSGKQGKIHWRNINIKELQ
jgi:hypothetical protein